MSELLQTGLWVHFKKTESVSFSAFVLKQICFVGSGTADQVTIDYNFLPVFMFTLLFRRVFSCYHVLLCDVIEQKFDALSKDLSLKKDWEPRSLRIKASVPLSCTQSSPGETDNKVYCDFSFCHVVICVFLCVFFVSRQKDSQVLSFNTSINRLFLELNVSNTPSPGQPAEDAHNAVLSISIPPLLIYSGVRTKVVNLKVFQQVGNKYNDDADVVSSA